MKTSKTGLWRYKVQVFSMMRTSFADLKYRNKLLKDMLNKRPAEPSHVNARIFFVAL